jgi:hypothetical protein
MTPSRRICLILVKFQGSLCGTGRQFLKRMADCLRHVPDFATIRLGAVTNQQGRPLRDGLCFDASIRRGPDQAVFSLASMTGAAGFAARRTLR